MGELLALVALACFSLNTICVRVASEETPYEWGFFIALMSQVAVGSGMVLLAVMGRVGELSWDWSAIGLFGLSGVFGTYLGRLALFRSIAGLGATRASAFQIMQPIFAALLAFILLGETLTRIELLLLVVVLIGLYLVYRSRIVTDSGLEALRYGRVRHHLANERPPVSGVPEDGGVSVAIRPRSRLRLAAFGQRHALALVALAGAFSYGLSNVVRGAAVRRWPEVLIGTALGTFVPVAIYLWRHVRPRHMRTQMEATPRRGLVLFATSGVLMMTAQASVIGALQYLPVAVASAITASMPVVIMAVSSVFMQRREQLTAKTVAGGLITWVGVVGFLLL